MRHVGKTGIIFSPVTGDWSIAAERVAGVPLLTRILISAERAGVHRVIVCAGEAASRLRDLVAKRPPQCRIEWIGTSADELGQALGQDGTSPCFFIRASTVLNPAALTELRAAFHPGVTAVVPSGQGPETPVALRIPEVAAGQERLSAQVPLSGTAVCLDLSSTTAEAAAAILYRALGKSTDSWLIHWSRRLLFPVMRAVLETPLTPNQLTLLGFLIGLGAIGCLWQGNYPWTVAGAALFVVAYLTDLLDGMLARLKLQESQWGRWMDYALDNLVHLGIFAGIVRAVYLRKPDETVLILGALIIAGAVISGCIAAVHMIQSKGPVNRLLAQLMHRDFSVILLLAALLNRLEWFLWAAAIGINLFWPFILYLLIRDKRIATGMRVEHPGLSGAGGKEG